MCRRTEPFSVPRQRSGRGPPASPPPPSQPLPGRPRRMPCRVHTAAMPRKAAGQRRRSPARQQPPPSPPRRACAACCGAAGMGGREACGRPRGARAAAGRAADCKTRWRQRDARAVAAGRKGGRGACGPWAPASPQMTVRDLAGSHFSTKCEHKTIKAFGVINRNASVIYSWKIL